MNLEVIEVSKQKKSLPQNFAWNSKIQFLKNERNFGQINLTNKEGGFTKVSKGTRSKKLKLMFNNTEAKIPITNGTRRSVGRPGNSYDITQLSLFGAQYLMLPYFVIITITVTITQAVQAAPAVADFLSTCQVLAVLL